MKKKFYVGMALPTGAAVLSAYVANQKAQRSDLLRANIEALAADEGGGEGGGDVGYFPCAPAEKEICYFKAKDGVGNSYSCDIAEFKRI